MLVPPEDCNSFTYSVAPYIHGASGEMKLSLKEKLRFMSTTSTDEILANYNNTLYKYVSDIIDQLTRIIIIKHKEICLIFIRTVIDSKWMTVNIKNNGFCTRSQNGSKTQTLHNRVVFDMKGFDISVSIVFLFIIRHHIIRPS